MKWIIVLICIASHFNVHSQSRYFTREGKIRFYSKSLLEDIEATNKNVTAAVDASTGAIQFALKMRGFRFRKSLMQEHFNENYVESDKYPQGEFRGKITNNEQIDYSKDGVYSAQVSGTLQIHGQTNTVETEGTISVKGSDLTIRSEFKIMLTDYKIDIPALVKNNISNTILVTVDAVLLTPSGTKQ